MKKLLVFLSITALTVIASAQNLSVSLNATSSPISGCQLSSTQVVKVNIYNNGSPAGGGSYTVFYTVNGGSTISQVAGTPLGPSGSYNFSFATTANLSVCGSYQMKVWVKHPSDLDPANDTVTWLVQNDCIVIPGNIVQADTVCSSGNAGTLNIVGWSNGSISNWQSSTNGGGSWTTISNSTPSQPFVNLLQTTDYRINYNGGLCPNAISPITSIMVENPPIIGFLSGPDTLCSTNSIGSLNVTGSATIEEWQFSTDNGATWTSSANTTNTFNFPSLIGTTIFRVKYLTYSCASAFSNDHKVTIEEAISLASVFGSDSICASGGIGSLTAVGVTTSINFWESSTNNGLTWTNIANTNSFINYFNPTQTTLYRFNLDGIYCPDSYSSNATIFIQPIPIAPILSGATSLCEDNDNGTLNVANGLEVILNWESSIDNGASWSAITNLTNTQSYTNLGQSTLYRVNLEGELCADYYSTTTLVEIDSLLVPADILSSATYCINSIGSPISLTANLNAIDEWEISTNNGVTWIGTGINTPTFDISGITQNTVLHVLLDGGACPNIISDTAFIGIDNLIPGTIQGGGIYCAQTLNELVSVNGFQGAIAAWQTSTNGGASWTSVVGTNDTIIFPIINQTTEVRFICQGTVCPADTSVSVQITVDQQTDPGILNEDKTICTDDSTHLILANYVSTSFSWESSTNSAIWNAIPSTYDSLNILENISQSVWIRVIVKNGMCGFDTSNFIYIDVKPVPLVVVSTDVSIDEGDTTTLNAASAFTGVWSPFQYITNPNLAITTCFPSETTDYFYTVIDNFGCSGSDTLRVTVIPSEEFEIMNLITANNDQFNDEWIIQGIDNFPNTEVTVFNVYGDRVYQNSDYKNEWKGQFKSKNLPDGTYYYVVKQGLTETIFKGTLSILGNE